jgi:hypothetical protein
MNGFYFKIKMLFRQDLPVFAESFALTSRIDWIIYFFGFWKKPRKNPEHPVDPV